MISVAVERIAQLMRIRSESLAGSLAEIPRMAAIALRIEANRAGRKRRSYCERAESPGHWLSWNSRKCGRQPISPMASAMWKATID